MTTSDRNAPWPQLVFHLASAGAQALEDALFAQGALSVTYQDPHERPVLEPAPGEVRLWQDVRLVALYAQGSDLTTIISALQQRWGQPLPAHSLTTLQDRQWERTWMHDSKPLQFGPDLWICPTHCQPVDTSAVNVRLDPGLAFGTGTHATTAQCLQWLGQHSVAGRRVLDYGCGSGILAVTAAMLGAVEVIAVDIDAQAVVATRENALLNGVEAIVSVGLPALATTVVADVVLANILFQPLLQLAQAFTAITRPGGDLVLSGLLPSQVDAVMLRYNQSFAFQSCGQQDDWVVLHARRINEVMHEVINDVR